MKKFKKGDLVKVYGNMGKGVGGKELPVRNADYYSSGGWIGRVLDRFCDSEINVRLTKSPSTLGKSCDVTVHPKQCRFFKPKAAK
jgi:hypothetical protein